MADKIRIGIIGAGGIFRTRHFPGLAQIDDAEVVAICNRSEESGGKIATEFGLSTDLMTDPHALIARDDIDAVMIGTWPYKHCEFVLESLNAGKHAFVQARMAMNLREAKIMYAAAMESDLAHQICQPPHALKGDWFMQRLIAEGYVGDIRNIVIRSMTPGGYRSQYATTLATDRSLLRLKHHERRHAGRICTPLVWLYQIRIRTRRNLRHRAFYRGRHGTS